MTGRRIHRSLFGMCFVLAIHSNSLVTGTRLTGEIKFREETNRSGFKDQFDYMANKQGGPLLADLNGDNFDDMALCDHNAPIKIFHRVGKGNFEPVEGIEQKDWHGLSVDDIDADGHLDFLISIGGSSGEVLKSARIFLYNETESSYEYVEDGRFGMDQANGRGRSTRFIDMDLDGDQDVLVNNRAANGVKNTDKSDNWMYENIGQGQYRLRDDSSMIKKSTCSGTALVTDFNDDRILDVVCVTGREITALQGTGRFPNPFVNVTREWATERFVTDEDVSFISANELDYDNDGLMDIYLTCGGNPAMEERSECDDILLRNSGSSFVDVSKAAGIPQGGNHGEASVGDFNLDGYTDLFIPNYGPGLSAILTNQGNGTFFVSFGHGANPAKSERGGASGAGALMTKVDGLLDLMVGFEPGPWRFYRNKSRTGTNKYLRVLVEDGPKASARGAKVTVVAGSLKMTRRVGSSGQYHQNYQKNVHFGLGMNSIADEVRIEYVGGKVESKKNVPANSRKAPARNKSI